MMEFARHPDGMKIVSVTGVNGRIEMFTLDAFNRMIWSKDNASYRIRYDGCYDIFVSEDEAKRFAVQVNKLLQR
jgi:hypothetical protein